jgi:hypothetical protein
MLMAVTRGVMAVTRAKYDIDHLKAGAHSLLSEDSSQRSEQRQVRGKALEAPLLLCPGLYTYLAISDAPHVTV